MSSNTPFQPDDLFNEGFKNFEAPYNSGAWENMKALLDKDEEAKPVLLPPQKINIKKSPFLILIIMTTISLISAIAYLTLGIQTNGTAGNINNKLNSEYRHTTDSNNNTVQQDVDNTQTISEQSASNNTAEKIEINQNNQTFLSEKSQSSSLKINRDQSLKSAGKSKVTKITSGSSKNKSTSTKAFSSTNSDNIKEDGDPLKTSVTPAVIAAGTESKIAGNTLKVLTDAGGNLVPDSPFVAEKMSKTEKKVARYTWVDDVYQYVDVPLTGAIDDFWIGIHFTQQYSQIKVDSGSNQAGFNLQFMSGNQLKKNDVWGAYGGFDFGMQFYGRTPKSNVVINTVNQDSGFTRLSTISYDFLARAHFEYAKFPIIPYFNAFGGPRLYSTSQRVASYLQLKNNESSSSNNAHTSASLVYGIGVGARVRLTPRLSLDARYEIVRGSSVKMVDMDQSKFSGLNYNLKYNTVNPAYGQFKVGLIFDLSEMKEEKKLLTPGHYVESYYDSVYVDPKDSNIRYLPCQCEPCPKKSYEYIDTTPGAPRTQPRQRNTPSWPSENGGGNGGGNGGRSGMGGGSRGSFPGIKVPSSIPK
ncbi:MAG: hypothetical protein H7321_00110 [Bacteroidia bacterium]|nr:hypothetical protein [Bacteroidia bacterium]